MKMVTRHYVSCKVKSGRPRLPSRLRMDEERRTRAPKGDVVMRSAEQVVATTCPVSAGHGGDGAVELVHSHCGHSLALVGRSHLECCFYCLACLRPDRGPPSRYLSSTRPLPWARSPATGGTVGMKLFGRLVVAGAVLTALVAVASATVAAAGLALALGTASVAGRR